MLYNILLEPIEDDIKQCNPEIIMTSLDGVLRYIPFAALYDGNQYMIDKYQFVVFTEAVKSKLDDVNNEEWNIAGLGTSKSISGFEALPSVVYELDNIVKENENDPNGILDGIICLDEKFTFNSFLDVIDDEYSILHIASHFEFNSGTTEDSFLLLGDGNKLTLATMNENALDFNDLEMLTLSACETALGGMESNGSEIEGFGALAQLQGAKSVLATLWPVADVSTGILMQTLYKYKVENPSCSKIYALQRAQKELKDSDNFSHPVFWAPYILIGNWK